MQRLRDIETQFLNQMYFYQIPHLKAQIVVEKWRRKGCKGHKGWMTARKQCLPNRTGFMDL